MVYLQNCYAILSIQQYTTKTIAKVVHATNQKADLILCQNSRDEFPTELSKTDFRNAKKKLKF